MTVGDFLYKALKNEEDDIVRLLSISFEHRANMYMGFRKKETNSVSEFGDNATAKFLVMEYEKLVKRAMSDIMHLIQTARPREQFDKILIAIPCDPGNEYDPVCHIYSLDRDKFLKDYHKIDISKDFNYDSDYIEISNMDYPIYDVDHICLIPREELILYRYAPNNAAISGVDIAAAMIKDMTAFGFSNEEFEKGRTQEIYEMEHPEEGDDIDVSDVSNNDDYDDTEELLNDPQYVKDRMFYNYRIEVKYFDNLYLWLTQQEWEDVK